MKTLVVATIAALLAVAAPDVAGGKHAPESKVHGKLSRARKATGKLPHSKMAHGPDTRQRGDAEDDEDVAIDDTPNATYDELIKCAKEYGATDDDLATFLQPGKEYAPHLFECFAGCYYQSINFTTAGDFNNDVFAEFIADEANEDLDTARKSAKDCEKDLAELTDFCQRGEAIDKCIRKSLPIYEISG